MKTFFTNLSLLFKRFGRSFVGFFKFFSGSFRKNRNTIIASLLVIFSTFAFTTFALSSGQYMPNIKPQKLSEISFDFQRGHSESFGVLYGHKMSSYESVYYLDSETATEMREIDESNTFFNFYEANYKGNYSPCVIDYDDERNVGVSLLLWPKKSYLYTSFQYEMPLLCPSSTSIPGLSSPSDIYINQKWADHLLKQYGFAASDYESLLGRNVTIPYRWNWGEAGVGQSKTTDVLYVIRGVIDGQSAAYLKYKSLFGDFFLANEYLLLPIPGFLYFSLQSFSQTNRKTFELLFDKYQYSASMTNYSDGSSMGLFEYRIGFASSMDSDDNILRIDDSDNQWCQKINALYDTFVSNNNVVQLILLLLLNVLFFAVSFFLMLMYPKHFFNNRGALPNERLYFCLGFYFLLTFGLLLGTLAMKVVALFTSSLSYQNWIAFLIVIVECFALATTNFLQTKKIPLDGQREV